MPRVRRAELGPAADDVVDRLSVLQAREDGSLETGSFGALTARPGRRDAGASSSRAARRDLHLDDALLPEAPECRREQPNGQRSLLHPYLGAGESRSLPRAGGASERSCLQKGRRSTGTDGVPLGALALPVTASSVPAFEQGLLHLAHLVARKLLDEDDVARPLMWREKRGHVV
jgi:hypothetical protein